MTRLIQFPALIIFLCALKGLVTVMILITLIEACVIIPSPCSGKMLAAMQGFPAEQPSSTAAQSVIPVAMLQQPRLVIGSTVIQPSLTQTIPDRRFLPDTKTPLYYNRGPSRQSADCHYTSPSQLDDGVHSTRVVDSTRVVVEDELLSSPGEPVLMRGASSSDPQLSEHHHHHHHGEGSHHHHSERSHRRHKRKKHHKRRKHRDPSREEPHSRDQGSNGESGKPLGLVVASRQTVNLWCL